MEWSIKLEARPGWGAVETIEVARLERRVVGLMAEEVGLSLAEAKDILAELQRLILQTQMEEYATCGRICPGCPTPRRRRDRRTRTIQTLFGTVTVGAPRIGVCPCQDTMGFKDLSIPPLAELLPDRCTPELRRVQAELGARYFFREAGRLLSAFLPCPPPNHASVRNRLARVADALEAGDPARGRPTAGRLAAGPVEDGRAGGHRADRWRPHPCGSGRAGPPPGCGRR